MEFVFILEELVQFLGKEDIELMAVVARMLLLCRNASLYGKKVSPSSIVIGCASESLKAFQLAKSRKNSSIERVNTNNVRWKGPMNDFVKINLNAAMDKSRRKMGIGVVFRDDKGKVLSTTLVAPKDCIVESNIAEAATTLRTIKLCQELGFQRVDLKGDAFQVVQALNKDCTNWSWYNHLIEESRDLLNCLQN